MPIDNRTFLKYQGDPEPSPIRKRPWWVAPLVFLAGVFFLSLGMYVSKGNIILTRIYIAICFAGSALWSVSRLALGWSEGGILGLFYRDKYPLGSILGGDEDRDGLSLAFWLLSGLALLAIFLCIGITPAAFFPKSLLPVPSP